MEGYGEAFRREEGEDGDLMPARRVLLMPVRRVIMMPVRRVIVMPARRVI